MLLTEGKRFVAFFDILGFSSWVENEGSKVVFNFFRNYFPGLFNFLIRVNLPSAIVNLDMSVEFQKTDIGYINFSDSILFYSVDDSY